MNEKLLLQKCKSQPIKERVVFHSSVQYGFSKIIRKMSFYPSFLPICAYFEHSSPPFYDEIWEIDCQFLTDIFFHRKDFTDQWNEKFKPIHKAKARTFTSPFAWYQKKYNVSVDNNAKGSLFFIHHTREGVEREHDKLKILNKIENLDSVFQPVTFCFYYLDVLKGLHKEYQELGYTIVTAGTKDNPNYIEEFYNLVKDYKYALTNSIGGHLLFSIKIGIPVSYFEDLEPTHISSLKGFDDSRIRLKNSKVYQKAKLLFKGVNKSINQEQFEYVNIMLGVERGTNRLKLMLILYKSLFSYIFYRFKKKLR